MTTVDDIAEMITRRRDADHGAHPGSAADPDRGLPGAKAADGSVQP